MFRYLTNLLFLTIWLSGCGYEYHIKDEGIVAQQRKLFNQLCDAKDRSIIYQTAQAEGYLSASREGNSCELKIEAWEPIVKYGYSFSECTTANITDHRLPGNVDVYRYTLEPEKSPLCSSDEKYYSYHQDDSGPKLNEFGWVSYFIKEYKTQLQGKCLVVKKVDTPMSQYIRLRSSGFYDENEKLFYDNFYNKYKDHGLTTKKGLISFYNDQIIVRSTGEPLSQSLDYTFYPKGTRFSYSTSLKCSERKEIRPTNVLIPASSH